jgi:hypothetical protein
MGTSFADDGAEAAERELNDFATRYTMQEERDVHATVSAAASEGPLPLSASDAPADTHGEPEDLGDNVELF